MRLELAITVPPALTESDRLVHTLVVDALCEYTVHVLRNNVNPGVAEADAVGLDGKGKLKCRNGVTIAETLVAST